MPAHGCGEVRPSVRCSLWLRSLALASLLRSAAEAPHLAVLHLHPHPPRAGWFAVGVGGSLALALGPRRAGARARTGDAGALIGRGNLPRWAHNGVAADRWRLDVPLQAPPRSQPADRRSRRGRRQAPGPGDRRAPPEDPPPPHRRAGADPLRQAAHRGRPASPGPRAAARRAGPGAGAAVGGRQGPAHPGRLRRHPRLRPDRPPAAHRRHHRGHGQRPRHGVRGEGAARSRRPTPPSSTTSTCAASSTRSSPRSAGASTRPRPSATPASPTAPASTR